MTRTKSALYALKAVIFSPLGVYFIPAYRYFRELKEADL